MPTKLDSRQSVNRSALSMVGSAANDSLDTILPKIDAELAKLFEDRNILLTDGGLITFTGTQVQFTEVLNLVINQKISGAAPQIISLASTTRTVSATGRMIYAVVDRTAGTATVTDDATTLAAVTSANQEVFLIAKRVDAGDGTQRLYWRNGMALNAGQTVRLGASGSGSGNGASKSPIPGYQWLSEDDFDVLGASASSQVTTTSYTNAVQNIGKSLYRLLCDKSRTVATSSGTALTINLAPGFTVAIGDIVYLTSGARINQWRRISAVGSQTSFTLDAAFTGGDASAADTLMVSQAVWTKDLVNFGSATEKVRARDFFSGNISQVAVDYFDSLVVDDDVPDYVDPARVVMSASNSGVVADTGVPVSNTFSPIFTRNAYPNVINDYVLSVNSTQERLHLAFFPNPTNGSVTTTANLLKYEASLYAEANIQNGGVLFSAYCNSDGSGTEINCNAPSTVSGKTRLQLSSSYVPAVNPGTTRGQLAVFADGLEIPRFVSGSTTDAYYKEIQNATTGVYDTLEFHADFSLLITPISIEIIKSEGIVDSSTSNNSRISTLNPIIVGTSAQVTAGTANYSSLQSAINAASSGAKILMLESVTVTENVSVDRKVNIQASGHSSVVSGTLTFTSAADFSLVKYLRVTGAITFNSGADGIFMTECWQATGQTITDNGAGNQITVIQE